MNFELTEAQQLFRDSVRGFAEKHLLAGAVARAHDPAHPFDIARLMAKQGLLGITMPEADGGQGGSLTDAVIAIETVASVCPRSADVVQAGNFGPVRVLAEYGNADHKARYLAPILAGDAVVCVGMTEPEAGSAVTDLKTTATPDGKGWRVSGSKVFTTHGPYAKVILAYVRFGPGVGGIGSVLIEPDWAGVSFGKRATFMSGEDWAQMYFDKVYVPAENLLLGPGGFKKQIAGFNVERIGNTARSLALGRYCFEQAREWALTRKQFGRPLAEFQGLQWKFADMKVKLDAGQLLLYRAAANADRGFPSAEETAIAKAFCNQAGFEIANEALQVMGGTGLSRDTVVEQVFREVRAFRVYDGPTEVHKWSLAKKIKKSHKIANEG